MNVNVEFTGMARSIIGQKQVSVELEKNATYKDVIRRLGKTYPSLIGLLIDVDGQTFLSGNMFIIDGNLATPAFVMGDQPKDGECLIIMSLVTGG